MLKNTLMMCTLTRNNYIKIVCGCNTLFCRPARLRGSDYFFLITQSFRLLCDTPRQGASLHWANTLSPAQVRAQSTACRWLARDKCFLTAFGRVKSGLKPAVKNRAAHGGEDCAALRVKTKADALVIGGQAPICRAESTIYNVGECRLTPVISKAGITLAAALGLRPRGVNGGIDTLYATQSPCSTTCLS